jgi:ATP-dependent protease ClpP protease subunit
MGHTVSHNERINMSIKNVLVVMAVGIFSASSVRAEEFSPRNTLIIDQPIDRETMAPVMDKMNRLLALKQAPSEIKLIIDSPGGSVYTGFKFIVQMKALQARGTVIKCYVPGLAASMAFHILTHCDERTVVQESALLWHRARVFVMMGAFTAPVARELARDLQQVDDHILREVKQALSSSMSDKEIEYHFERETLHIGRDLCAAVPKFCTAKAAIPGLLETLARRDIVHALPIPANFSGEESMIYLYFEYLVKMLNNK